MSPARTKYLSAVLMLPVLTGCIGTKYVPAPGAPAAIAPAFLLADAPSPPPGKGRLVLDVTGAPATVFEVKEPKPDDPEDRALLPLCKTPCAVNLERGPHRIAFVSPSGLVGSENVVVGHAPIVLREQLGYVEPHTAPWLFGVGTAAVGLGGLVTGAVLALQGDGPDRDPAKVRDARAIGGATLAVSAGVLALAWLLLHAGRTEIQPSAAVVFPEPR